jgi:hypothetical protein
MNRRHVAASGAHASTGKPPPAVQEWPDGPDRSAETDDGASRTERIREAAYRLYEARGCEAGHALDDWLAAEAALDGGAPPRPASAAAGAS